jgi:hypothetical protein
MGAIHITTNQLKRRTYRRSRLTATALAAGITLCAISVGCDLLAPKPPEPTQVGFIQQPGNTVAGQPIGPIRVAVQDERGGTVTRSTPFVTLVLTANGDASANAPLIGTARRQATEGVVVFDDLKIEKAASGYRLTATSTALEGATSVAFSIMHAAASQVVVITQPPASLRAGEKMTVVLEIRDQYGNPVTTDPSSAVTEQVVISFTPGTNGEEASFSGATARDIDWTTGRATFTDLSVDRIGNYTLTAGDVGMPANLADATTNALDVIPGAPAKLVVVSNPVASSVAGASLGVTIEVQDQFGNAVRTDPAPGAPERVTLDFTTGTNTEGATLGGTRTRDVDWTTGRVSFSNLFVDKVGNYSITGGDAGMPVDLTDGTTTAFDVTPAAAAKLAIATPPVTTPAGSSITMVVEIQDQFGNAIKTDPNPSPGAIEQVTVDFTAATNTEGATLSGTKTRSIEWATGRASFNDLAVDKAGNYGLSASDAGMPNDLTDANPPPFDITVGAPAKLVVVTQPPTSLAAGASFTIVIEVQDQQGNAVKADPNAGASESVTLAFTPGTNTESAALSGTTTRNVEWSTGRATFSDPSVNKAGNYSLTATDVNMPSNLTDAPSNTFDVTFGAPSKLVVAQQPPATVAAGEQFTVVFEVQDQFGNTVKADPSNANTESVSVGFTAGTNTEGALLTGPTSQNVNWTNGRAVFAGLAVSAAGSYSLTASDAGMPANLTDATTNEFTVTAGVDLVVQVDVKPVTVSFGMGIGLIFYDAATSLSTAITQAKYLEISHSGSDLPLFAVSDGNGHVYRSSAPMLGNWYTVRITHSSSAGTADITITDRGTGQPFFTQSGVTFNPVNFTAAAYGTVTASGDGTNAEMHYDNVTVTRNGSVVYSQSFASAPAVTFSTAPQAGDSYTWDSGLAIYKIRLAETSTTTYKFAVETFTPSPAALAVTAQPPATVVAGATLSSVVVEVRDAAGAPVTSDPNAGVTEQVTIAFTAGTNGEGATLSGTTTRTVEWTTGRATFNDLSVDKVGNYSLTATDVNMPSNLTDAPSNTFDVTFGAPSKLAVLMQPPATSPVGTAFTTVVEVQDQQGNAVKADPNAGATEQVTVAFTAGTNTEGATLGGTTTVNVNWTTGRATFSDLTISRIGTFGLSASDVALPTNLTDAASTAIVAQAVAVLNDLSVTNISGTTGDQLFYRIAVPAGQFRLNVTISDGTGDADLYVRSADAPTQTTYNCRPFLDSNSEFCSILTPAAGDWYVMLRAFVTYSGLTLNAKYVHADTVAAGVGFILDMTRVGNTIYFVNQQGNGIMSVPVAGGTMSTISSATHATNIITDGTNVYWTEAGATNLGTVAVKKYTIATNSVSTLADGLAGLWGGQSSLSTDGVKVYFIAHNAAGNGYAIRAVSVNANNATPADLFSTVSGDFRAPFFTVSGDKIYFRDPALAALRRMTTAGASVTTLTSAASPHLMTVSGSDLYFTDLATGANILVIENASTLSGPVTPTTALTGTNPIGTWALDGTKLYLRVIGQIRRYDLSDFSRFMIMSTSQWDLSPSSSLMTDATWLYSNETSGNIMKIAK